MARIKTYSLDGTINPADKLIGSDGEPGSNFGKTKNYSVSTLGDGLISLKSIITGSGTINTIPMFTPTGVKIGDSIITQAALGQGVTVTGQLDVTDDFNVTGSTQLNGTLTVEGDSAFNASSVINDSVTVNDKLIDGTGSPGTAGQVLSSDGGQVEWINSTGANTTYNLTGQVSNTNEFAIGLSGSDGTLDKVNFIPGTNITLTDNGSNGVTIDTGGTAIVPRQAQQFGLQFTNKTVGSPNFDVVRTRSRFNYGRQYGTEVDWSQYGHPTSSIKYSPAFDNGWDASNGFGSITDGALAMFEESVKDVLATTGRSNFLNSTMSIMSYDNFMLASQEIPLALRVDNNGASPGNGTSLIKLVGYDGTGSPILPDTVSVWFIDTTDTSSTMNGPIPKLVFSGKDTAYRYYDAGTTYTFTGNTGGTISRKYALVIEDEYYSNMRSRYLKVTGGRVVLQNLPTSDPSSNGVVWNDSGTLKISAG